MSCHYNADQHTTYISGPVQEVDSDAGILRILPNSEYAARCIQELCDEVHFANKKWWIDLKTGSTSSRS